MIKKTPSSGGLETPVNQLELGWWQSSQTPFGFASQCSPRQNEHELLTFEFIDPRQWTLYLFRQ